MNALDKYNRRANKVHSLLCIGLDSDIDKLPPDFANGLSPQLAFNRHIIDQTADFAAAYKFNMAFYEAIGAEGLRQLVSSLDYLRLYHPDILTICDAKRADIGNSSAAYVRAIFDVLNFDAVTLNPYLGRDALQPFLNREHKACIILCRTSNAGSGEFQNLLVAGKPLWQVVAAKVCSEWNVKGNCMLVTGATYPDELAQTRAIAGDMTLLVPGIGVQGGDLEMVIRTGTNRHGKGLIINASRSIIFAPDPAQAAETLRDSINRYRD